NDITPSHFPYLFRRSKPQKVKNEIVEIPPRKKIALNSIPRDGHFVAPLNKQRTMGEMPPNKKGIRNNRVIA
ncbi:MAG TPA: hypothetical protein VG324_21425, partial [Blastocatellia bacterium]|nr:hypothetical protein [Blastocatellia bacterium]